MRALEKDTHRPSVGKKKAGRRTLARSVSLSLHSSVASRSGTNWFFHSTPEPESERARPSSSSFSSSPGFVRSGPAVSFKRWETKGRGRRKGSHKRERERGQKAKDFRRRTRWEFGKSGENGTVQRSRVASKMFQSEKGCVDTSGKRI